MPNADDSRVSGQSDTKTHKKAQWLRSLLLVGLLLLVIVAAGVKTFWDAFKPQANQPVLAISTTQPVNAPGAPGLEGFDNSAHRSRIVLMSGPRSGDGQPFVSLGSPFSADTVHLPGFQRQGFLAREMIRQALLIAARDELGAVTRDGVLGDPAASAKEGSIVEVCSLFTDKSDTPNHAFIRRAQGTKSETLTDRALPSPYLESGGIMKFVDAAESLSRTEFPEALKKLGLAGKPHAVRAGGTLSTEIEDQLSSLDFVEPIAAVRSLHESIRADGESPARLGALVRGYALLGVLSEFQWHPAHKAFKARALLYAQRLFARDPKSTWALWHRAYALALAGLHREALVDLAQARSSSQSSDASTAPAWVNLIDALARCDAKALRIMNGPHARLAALLRLTVVEYPMVTSSTALQAARDVLATDPECYRAHEVMCRVRGVSNGHVATTVGPQILAQSLPLKLAKLGNLPAVVRKYLDNSTGGEPALYQALAQASEPGQDQGELSWGVLGHLIRETRFLQVYRRLDFLQRQLSVPVDDFWNESRLAVADHRFYPFLESLAAPSPESQRAMDDFLNHLDVMDLEPVEIDMIRVIRPLAQHGQPPMAWTTAQRHADDLVHDLAELVQDCDPNQQVKHARSLLAVSPHCDYAKAMLIEREWQNVQSLAGQWEKESVDSPALLGALGRHYNQQGKLDQAEDYLSRYLKLAPADFWAYEMLASSYKSRGDIKRWQETLEESLKTEDTGLNHAQARVALADYYMSLGQWAKAEPFAEAAGETWAGWAMQCAERCAEGRQDWQRGELWAERVSERYPSSSCFEWYLYCKRTGHGDVKAAREFAEQFIDQSRGALTLSHELLGYFFWLGGQPKEALNWFRKAYLNTQSGTNCVELMLVADEIGDTATRDDCLMKLTTKHRAEGPKTAQICEIFQKSVQKGDGSLDIKGLDQILATIPEPKRANTEFIVGLYLINHGKASDSRPYLVRCGKSPAVSDWMRAIASDALRGRKDTKTREVGGRPSANLGPAERHESGGHRGLKLGKRFLVSETRGGFAAVRSVTRAGEQERAAHEQGDSVIPA